MVHFNVTFVLLKKCPGKKQTVACLRKSARLYVLVHDQVLMCLSVLSGRAGRYSPPSEKDLCLSIYRMHHLHIFVEHPSACGLFCGGISSENQCCHGGMHVAPGSARVGSPTCGSHAGPICMSPAGADFKLKSRQTHFSVCSSTVGWCSSTVIQPPCLSVCCLWPEWLFVYESVGPDKTESDKVMNTNLANQFHFKYKVIDVFAL